MAKRHTKRRGSTKRRDLRARLGLILIASGLLLWWWVRPSRGLYIRDDAEALARVLQSEIGNGTRKQQRHVAWTARNLARERKQSIAEMVCAPCGPQQRGRPMSSRQAPGESQRELARKVLDAPPARDPTGGATHFLSPQLQNRLARSGKRAGYDGNSYRKVRRRWIRSYGWEPYYRIGRALEFWGPKRKRRRKKKR